MGAMTHRMLAAATAAVIGIGLTLAPVETFARPGGLASGRPVAFHGGFRPAVARPFVGVRRPAVPAFGGASLRIRTGHRPRAGHHRRVIGGFGLGGPYVYGTFYPADYVAPTDYVAPNGQYVVPYGQPPAAYPMTDPVPERIRVIVYRPAGCNSQTQTVPSKDGGERQITIVRC
jgi:hypothetical protein